MKNIKKQIKTLLAISYILSSVFFVSAINTGVSYADRAQDFCDETVPVTNSSTAGDNAACVTAARAAEARCAETNGAGTSLWLQCIENYYEGLTGTSSGSRGSNDGGGGSGVNGGGGSGVNGGGTGSNEVETDCNVTPLSQGNCQIIKYVVIGINTLSAIAGIALVFSLMFTGYLYMTARDNAGQVEKAKSRIVQTLIALTLFIFMYALLNFFVPGGLGL